MANTKRGKDKSVGKGETDDANKELFLNIPNMITLSRLGLTFVFIYMLFTNFFRKYLFIIFVIAALTDWLDGFLARKLNQKTKIGARMDQVIDRVFTLSIVSALLIHSITRDKFQNTGFLLLLICSREIISTPGVLIRVIKCKDLYQVKFIGKLTTFIQAFAIGAIILQLPYYVALGIAIPTCIIGILAGIDYLRSSLS